LAVPASQRAVEQIWQQPHKPGINGLTSPTR